jgi:ketosteroid isomerase-like protein
MNRWVEMLLWMTLGAASPAFGQAAPDPEDALVAADRALSDAVHRSGLRAGLLERLTPDAVLIYPGAPILRGSDKIAAFLAAQPLLDSITIEWSPQHLALSRDRKFGVTFGVTATHPAGDGSAALRWGQYIAAWRSDGSDWKLVALMQAGIVPSARAVNRPEFGPVAWPALTPNGTTRDFAQADLDFAALAGRQGAARAFETFAAPLAVTGGGGGPSNVGARAIGASVNGPPTSWKWFPVAAGGADTRDLGFTVGQAVIQPQGGSPSYTKYLTVWQRQPDGRVRFLTDGGNARPAP